MEAVLAIFVAVLAATCVAYCIIKPRYAIVPVLMLFPAEQIIMGYVPESRWKYGWVTNVVVGLIALFGATYAFFNKRQGLRGLKNGPFVCVLALYTYISISSLWTPSQESFMYFMNKSWAYIFLCYVLAPMLVLNVDDLRRVSMPLIITGIVIMALMLVNPRARFIEDRFTVDLGYVIGM